MNFLRGVNELLQLIGGQEAYTKCCANKVDTPMEEIAWRLHYVCLMLLIDDERVQGSLETDPIEERQRFIALEGLDNETANKIQNHYRQLFGKEPIYNKTADAVDIYTGELIELKCTPVFEENPTKYYRESAETSKALGIILVVCDTVHCVVIQPTPPLFVRGINAVVQLLLQRNEIMMKWNMHDNSTQKPVEYKKLPNFLENLYKNMNIKNEEFFDIKNAKFNDVPLKEIEKMIIAKEEESIKLERKVRKMSMGLIKTFDEEEYAFPKRRAIGIDEPSTSKSINWDKGFKRKLFDNEDNDRIFKKLKTSKDGKKLYKFRSERREYYNAKARMNKAKSDLNVLKDNLLMAKKPCCNRKHPIVVRDLNAKDQHKDGFLQEMTFEKIENLIKNHDEKCEKEGLYCKWQYGIPPVTVMTSLTNLDKKEFFIKCEFFEPLHYSKDGVNDFEGFKVLIEEMKRDPDNILNLGTNQLSKISRDPIARKALDLFGVGWKRLKQIGLVRPEGLKMKFLPNVVPKERGFPFWFWSVRTGLKEKHKNECGVITYVYPTMSREEVISHHPITSYVTKTQNTMLSNSIDSKLFHNMNLVQNLSYKLAGRAASSEQFVKEKREGKKQFNNMRIFSFELETVTYADKIERTGRYGHRGLGLDDQGRKRKEIYGYIFRGPTHAKDASDITNCFVFVFLDKDYSKDEMFLRAFPNYTLGKFMYGNKMMNYGIRRWGYKRVSPTYSCYIANALYEPMNSIGNKVFKILEENEFRDFEDPKIDLNKLTEQLISNTCDNFIIGVNMTNNDEGLMPFNRYLHLNLHSLISKEKCFCLDFDSFLKKFMDSYKIAGVVKFFTKITCNVARNFLE